MSWIKSARMSGKKVFREIPTGEEWRVNMTKEIIDVENDKLQVNGFRSE